MQKESAADLVTTARDLARLAAELGREPVVAVDLEADSMHSYREKVCLLQFSTPTRTVLVDPLVVPDLQPLAAVLQDEKIRKIFHAADYDIRCLFRDYRFEVRGLFDTMICCQFLGEPRVGLADVLGKYFGVSLDKKFQRADWSKRPLSQEMLDYAAADTRHLLKLASLLEERIREANRWAWVSEEFSLLEQARSNGPAGPPFFLRFKGAAAFGRRQLAVLEELLVWRDQEAERRDRPHFKVIGNRELGNIAQAMPTSLKALAAVEGVPPRLLDRYGRQLLAAVKAGLAVAEEKLPVYPPFVRPERDPAAEARLKKLKSWRSEKAQILGIDPGILINTALLEEIARQPPQDVAAFDGFTAMKNWQRQELGHGIVEALKR